MSFVSDQTLSVSGTRYVVSHTYAERVANEPTAMFIA
jgi:hypothetical protein